MRLNLFPLVTAAVLPGSCLPTAADEAKLKLKRVNIKEGFLLVQAKNLLAVANDKPAQYELSWGKFELTSDRLNVVVVEE